MACGMGVAEICFLGGGTATAVLLRPALDGRARGVFAPVTSSVIAEQIWSILKKGGVSSSLEAKEKKSCQRGMERLFTAAGRLSILAARQRRRTKTTNRREASVWRAV